MSGRLHSVRLDIPETYSAQENSRGVMLMPPAARLLKRPGVRLAILLVIGAFVLYALPIPSGFSQYIVPQHKNALVFDYNGLAHGWMPDGKVHPIEQLMARGKARWEELLSR